MLIETRGLPEKLVMPSLGGVMLSPHRLSRKCHTAQSRLNSIAPAIAKASKSSCYIFVQKSEEGSLQIANLELTIHAEAHRVVASTKDPESRSALT
jgi:hypothetical protein